MKKLPFCILSAFLIVLISLAHVKANTTNNPIETNPKSAILSAEVIAGPDKLNGIKPIERSVFASSEKIEVLRASVPLANVQDEHSRRYQRRHSKQDLDVSVQTDNQWRGNDFSTGQHSHRVAYIGVGGLLVFILVMILLI